MNNKHTKRNKTDVLADDATVWNNIQKEYKNKANINNQKTKFILQENT